MTSIDVGVVGTGLLGTSVALAARRAGHDVRAWDVDPNASQAAAEVAGVRVERALPRAVERADVVVVCTPIGAIAKSVADVLRIADRAAVTDVGSVKGRVLADVKRLADPTYAGRFVGGHPLGGSERSGAEHASASIVDGIVWVLTPDSETDPEAVERVDSFVRSVGARPVRIEPGRHDRLLAFVSHLPQVASTALMGLAAIEGSSEPQMLLLAAGGFRDLTRLAASNPALWSDILRANGDELARAIDLYIARLSHLRDLVVGGSADELRAAFQEAKAARLQLAAKPQVRAGVAVLQIEVPDKPGSLARLTGVLADAGVNIEDLQIVHSPEGGRGAVHLTVASAGADEAARVLGDQGFDATRLA
jgi:prephenate dehydrogenase